MRYNFRHYKERKMTKKAKQYTVQEKTRVAMEAIKGDLTMTQISSQYGVHATQINR